MPDVVWTAVTDAVARLQSGDVDGGREALEACWDATGPQDHALRCVVAHYLADVQEDLETEIEWDEAALAELPHVRDEDVKGLGLASAAGFAPSLHLNLGDGYLRRGDVETAARHLELGREVLGRLADDAYGVMIRRGFDRLERRISTPDEPGLPRR